MIYKSFQFYYLINIIIVITEKPETSPRQNRTNDTIVDNKEIQSWRRGSSSLRNKTQNDDKSKYS